MSQTSVDAQIFAGPAPDDTDRLSLTSMALRQVGQLDALQQITLLVARSVDVEADLPLVAHAIRERLGLRSVHIEMMSDDRVDVRAIAVEGTDLDTPRPASGEERFTTDVVPFEVVVEYGTGGLGRSARLPIRLDGLPVGALAVEPRDGERLDAEIVDLLGQIADMVGDGIQRSRRQTAPLHLAATEPNAGALLEIAGQLAAFPGISAGLQPVLDAVAATFDFSRVRLVIHGDDELFYLASPASKSAAATRDMTRLLSSRAVREAMERREQALVPVAAGDRACLPASKTAAQALITPVTLHDFAAGALVLELDSRRAFGEPDREIANQLARHLGFLVQREQRIETFSRQNLLLSLVERVTTLIARSTTADDLLPPIAREIRRTFGYNCSIGMVINGRLYFRALELAGQAEAPPWASEGIPLSLGVTGRVARTGEPAFIRNVASEPAFIDIGVGATSEICVPVLVEDEVVGVLNVESGPDEELDDLDFEVIMMVASHLGIALYNRRLIASERERRREIEAIQQVSTIVAETLDPAEAMRRMVDTLADRMGYPVVSLATLEGDELVLRAVRGYDQDLMPRAIAVTSGISGRTVRTGRPVFVEDVDKDPDFVRAREDVTSEVCVPIRCADEIVGILNVEGTADRPLTERDSDLLMTFAEHAGVLLNNAHAYAEVSRQATLDPVTGVPNHRYFQEQMQAEIEHAEQAGEPLSLLVIDLDGFKDVNDRFGHLAGDQVLRDIARRMTDQVRAEDLVARYAGDEFVVLLPGMASPEALEVAQRLLDAARHTPLRIHDGKAWAITLSVGIASYPDDGATPTEILRAADMAMYLAKESGKNSVSLSGDVTLARRDRRKPSPTQRRARP